MCVCVYDLLLCVCVCAFVYVVCVPNEGSYSAVLGRDFFTEAGPSVSFNFIFVYSFSGQFLKSYHCS